MLIINVKAVELWDEKTKQFLYTPAFTLQLEHSLISVSKWESKNQKFFMSKEVKTKEETLDYIKCMTINKIDDNLYKNIPEKTISEINEYINHPMTATIIPKIESRGGRKEQISAELIYFWLISFNIPFETEKWHLNRLLTLVEVCNHKNNPPKATKRSYADRNAANAARLRKRR